MVEESRRANPDDLEPLGMSDAEWAVYEVLIDHGSANAAELHDATAVSQTQVSTVLDGLETKGLVSQTEGQPDRYAAVPPEVGLELLLVDREEELRRARRAATDLNERFHQARARRDVSGLVEVVTGKRAVAERYSAVHRTAREQLRILARPPFVMPPEDNRTITTEAHGISVALRSIVDPRYFDFEAETGGMEFIRDDIARGEQYRVMANVPLKVLIADDHAALIPLEIHPKGIQSAVLFRASALLDALIEVFETCWAIAYPLELPHLDDGHDHPDVGSISAEEQQLLALLTAGIPDATIARQLDISHTTVQRRIRDLKDRLGATTRFQVGLQAAMRGWISD